MFHFDKLISLLSQLLFKHSLSMYKLKLFFDFEIFFYSLKNFADNESKTCLIKEQILDPKLYYFLMESLTSTVISFYRPKFNLLREPKVLPDH
ncbi:hypothetical protein BpHYR1_037912 [Brachionus plicatilis]|uniref:Uncharacterized protein n=1 Tax=Brachionus plicatilis TaxID=10195 RepID=A0A3M7SPM7_BRAPC|nr:hypothetical protein BpHYR1_037912 [Brachionus plicatilis]